MRHYSIESIRKDIREELTHELHDMARWQHKHHFHIEDRKGEKNTWRVILLTLVMMVVEIVAGFMLDQWRFLPMDGTWGPM